MAQGLHTPEHLQSLLEAANFLVPMQLSAAEPQQGAPAADKAARPEIPAADPATQNDLEKIMKHEFLGNRVRNFFLGNKLHELKGKQAETLHKTIDDIYAKIPDAIPEAKNLPPKPKFYGLSENDFTVEMHYLNQPGIKADAIISTKISLKGLTEEEKKAVMAHEVGHALIKANEDHPMPYTPPNMDAVKQDLKKLGIPDDPQNDRYKEYMVELQADSISVRTTRNPEALISALDKGQKILDKAVDNYVKEQIARQEYKVGHELSQQEKEKIHKDTEKMVEDWNSNNNPHPSNAVRAQAARMTEQELEKKDKKQEKGQLQAKEQHEVPTKAIDTPPPSAMNALQISGRARW